MAKEHHNERLGIRINAAMKEQWASKAAKEGLALSEWIRKVCSEKANG